jgi:hypothetical protein
MRREARLAGAPENHSLGGGGGEGGIASGVKGGNRSGLSQRARFRGPSLSPQTPAKLVDPWLPPPHSVWGATQPLLIQTVPFGQPSLTALFRAPCSLLAIRARLNPVRRALSRTTRARAR